MVKFDAEYYNRIYKFLNQQDDVRYKISDLTDDPEKFIFHIKYYIDNRGKEDLEVEFNSLSETEIMHGATYSEIRILEFFEGKVKDRQREKLINKIWQQSQQVKNKPAHVVQTVQPEESKKVIPPGYKTPGLFQ
jgi:hypothetical protein